MPEIRVLQLPPFKRAYKRLHPNQRRVVDDAVRTIVANPGIGQLKKGDLDGVYVHKFPCLDRQMLLAYEWDPMTRILLVLGVHENFYRNLKKYSGGIGRIRGYPDCGCCLPLQLCHSTTCRLAFPLFFKGCGGGMTLEPASHVKLYAD